MSSGLEDSSLFDLFRMEADEQVRVLQSELMLLESEGSSAGRLQNLMRASHSLKGSVGSFGAQAAFEAAQRLETLARNADLSGAEAAYTALATEIARLDPVLARLAGETPV